MGICKELRLGNIVQCILIPEIPEICVVDGITNESVKCSHLSDFVGEDNIKRIHLTTEWLPRLGFFQTTEKMGYADLYRLRPNYTWFVGITAGVYYLVKCNTYGFLALTEIKYVHQLQNLIFALTGNELALKEGAGK